MLIIGAPAAADSVSVVGDNVGEMAGESCDTLRPLSPDSEAIPDDTMSCLIAAISSVELQHICEAVISIYHI